MVYTQAFESLLPSSAGLLRACALGLEASRLLEASSALVQSITSIANGSKRLTADLVNSVRPLLLRIESRRDKSEVDADLSDSYRDALDMARTVTSAISRSTLDIRAVVGAFSIVVGPRNEKTKDCTLASLSDAMGTVLAEVTCLQAAVGEPDIELIRDSINGLHALDAGNLAFGKLTIEASEALLVQALRFQRVLESGAT